jgi:hypothetical protein
MDSGAPDAIVLREPTDGATSDALVTLDAGGVGDASPMDARTIPDSGGSDAESCGGGGSRCPCPVVNGIDGMGVCSAWQLSAWDVPCSTGYMRTRTCDPTYDCRTVDHNGCDAPVNIGSSPPTDCGPCHGGTLQYFGYWRDSEIQNTVCQHQDHSNYTMTADGQSIVDFAATFGVANFGFTAPTGGASPAPLSAIVLRDDADSSSYGYCASNPCPGGIIDGWNAIKAQVETAGDMTRAQHPGAHLMINLADGDANGQLDFQTIPGFTLPRGVDWVGMECYTGSANCQANMNVLRPLLPPGGRVWVLPAGTNAYGTEDYLVNDANAMYAWSNADPAVIGMIVFVWSNRILCPPDCTSLATHEMPNLLATYRRIGKSITGRTAVVPKMDSECPPP